jgi:hypothetical protein
MCNVVIIWYMNAHLLKPNMLNKIMCMTLSILISVKNLILKNASPLYIQNEAFSKIHFCLSMMMDEMKPKLITNNFSNVPILNFQTTCSSRIKPIKAKSDTMCNSMLCFGCSSYETWCPHQIPQTLILHAITTTSQVLHTHTHNQFSICMHRTINTWRCSSAGPAALLVLNSCCLIHTVPVKVQCQAMGVNCADGSILPADSVPVSLCQGPVWAAGILHYAQVQVCPHTRAAGKPRDLTAYLDQCSRQILGSVEMGSHVVHVSTNTNTTWTVLCITVEVYWLFLSPSKYNSWLHSSKTCVQASNHYIKWRWTGILLHMSTAFCVVCMEITQ